MRGNLLFAAITGRHHRSIPASAGEPCTTEPLRSTKPVYPRECGGTFHGIAGLSLIMGLSPRVRGNHKEEGMIMYHCGSIPASAGEPPPGPCAARRCGVYPRECGGTSRNSRQAAQPSGLSPRVRGNPYLDSTGSTTMRSIPASAGEPTHCRILWRARRVYPRECGGTQRQWVCPRTVQGLSPRVRGNQAVTGRRG